MLRDAARFAFGDSGCADRVEQRSLAVIDVAHDGDDRSARCAAGRVDVFGRLLCAEFLRSLLFKADDVGLSAEVAGQLSGKFLIERLVDGGEHAAHQQARDQIFRADIQLLGEFLDADSFGNLDRAADRQRLVGNLLLLMRHVALHWAFFDPARNIALSRSARRRTGAGCRAARRRWATWAYAHWAGSAWTCTGRRCARGV